MMVDRFSGFQGGGGYRLYLIVRPGGRQAYAPLVVRGRPWSRRVGDEQTVVDRGTAGYCDHPRLIRDK